MYKAIYRKYRPQSFADVVGQKHVVKTLQNAIDQEKIGHAYLFHGPRGTGKTSIAKIFAEAVNCQAPTGSPKPCHQCENCLLIDGEQATDIIELDAASNNGVDEIRQIREFARYAPTQLKCKVYIIDEVHMLSTAAFNALLKTLEEPPAHVIFILATTEIHKIPQTIISRCQRFDFKKVTIPEMIECINPILEKENIRMADEALTYLAEYADGGMRDALSVLDQVSAYSDGEIALKDIQDVIGTVSVDTYEKLLQDVIDGNSRDILLELDEVVASGKNIQLFVEEFLKYLLREIEKNIGKQSKFDARILFFMLEKMNKLAAEMRTAFLPQVALQALFLEITYDSENDETTQHIIEANKVEAPIDSTRSVEIRAEKTEIIIEEQQNDAVEQLLFVEEISEVEKTSQAIETAIQEEPKVEAQEDVLALFDADNFIADEEEELYVPQDEFVSEFTNVKIAETVIVGQSLTIEQNQEEITTIFEEINIEKQQVTLAATSEFEVVTDKIPEETANIEALNDEKRKLLLQRVMAEVVIYPEYNQLEKIKRKWQLIKFDPMNQIAVMLRDMEPKIATKKEIVLSCYNKALANQLQMKSKKEQAEAFISELIGQPYEIISVDEAIWRSERAIFSDKWRANEISEITLASLHQDVLSIEEQAKAQGYEYVTLDFEDETVEEEPIVAEAKALFGDDIIEVK